MDLKTANELRRKYPNHIPLAVAGKLLDVSTRQLSGRYEPTGRGGIRAVCLDWREHRHSAMLRPHLYGAFDCLSER